MSVSSADAASSTTAPKPTNFGALVFNGMDMLDIWGPLDVFQLNAHTFEMHLELIGVTMDPITTGITDLSISPSRSSFYPKIHPTATINDDLDLDVLLVPGGPGIRAASGLEPLIAFIKKTYPKLQYLLTVCTGASLAARAGVLDGRRATTNKRAWELVRGFGPEVKWVAPARYVVDGNIWSSSGVTSSLDLAYAFVAEIYGKDQSTLIANTMEHTPIAPDEDVFAEIWGVAPTSN
ncbi:isonitrile hydratase [Favolaschia claudopus]|uniref:Isonitrile hydratase n=1 Tax=Favolaschia claudopus TaxID=2862362 RepID=A0AAW0CSE8_9AGAR